MKKNGIPESTDIAVIGMSCCFPDAESPEEFWQNLQSGKDSVTDIPSEREKDHSFSHIVSKKGSFVRDPYLFDHEFFRIGKVEAAIMDPQQRMLLELAVSVIRNAGFEDLKNQSVGIFIGATQQPYAQMLSSDYYRRNTIRAILDSGALDTIPADNLGPLRDVLSKLDSSTPPHPSMLVGNILNMLAGRISHELNLTGPSLSIDTACSSSLVAVHLACGSILRNECEMALAGGINLNLSPSIFQYLEIAGAVSPSGHSWPFSAMADGMVLGEGGGLILLKKASKAQKDGNHVLAIIRGSGINNDGRSLGVMAPNPRGQLALLEKVYREIRYDRQKISYIEAHGTGTRIGDALEINTIRTFFAPSATGLSVGSVKSNIGHLLGAAGIAGFIKVVLSLINRQLPPSLHVGEVNPKWQLGENLIRIQTELESWESEYPRAAGINSFGFGGTNCHMILEEAPVKKSVKSEIDLPGFRRERLYVRYFPEIVNKPVYLHQLTWHKKVIPDLTDQKYSAFPLTGILINMAGPLPGGNTGPDIYGSMTQLVRVCQGAEFIRKEESRIQMDLTNSEHYRWLFSMFNPLNCLIQIDMDIIVESGEAGTAGDAYLNIMEGVKTMHSLLKALKEREIKIRLTVITRNAFYIPDISPAIDPVSHAFATAFSGIFEENPLLRGGLIDIDPGEISDFPSGFLFRQLIFHQLTNSSESPAIMRKGKTFLPDMTPVYEVDDNVENKLIYEDGVFLVVGGSSGAGLEIAGYLAERGCNRVYISGTRSPEEFQHSNHLTPDIQSKISYIRSSILDGKETKEAIDRIYLESGKLSGIFFAPGRISYGSFAQMDPENAGYVIAPKIRGVLNLSDSLEGREPGFVCLISSLSGIAPVFSKGMVAYATGNAFLDAFAVLQQSRGHNWLSVDWSLWNKTGMAARVNSSGEFQSDSLHALEPGFACRQVDKIIALKMVNIIVADPLDRQKFTFQYTLPSTEMQKKTEREKHTSGTIITDSDMKSYLRDKIIRAADLEPSEMQDDQSFQMMGIDSLAALDVIREIEEETGAVLNPTLLFEYDTLNKLSKFLETKVAKQDFAPKKVSPEKDLHNKEYGLLPSQQVFYANQLFYPDQPCNMFIRVDFPFELDRERLKTSFLEVLNRHEALQVSFKMTESGPVQQPHVLSQFDFEIYHIQPEDFAKEVAETGNRLLNKVIELDRPPLLKTAYCYTGNGNSSLMISMHHIVADAVSLGFVFLEILNHYSGKISERDPQKSGFFGYLADKLMNPGSASEALSSGFWKKELDNLPGRVNLPYKTPEKDSKKQSRIESAKVNQLIFSNLLQFSRHHQLTTFQSLLAVCFLFFQKVCRQNDLVIRVAVLSSDRKQSGIAAMVGCLADTIPVRFSFQEGEDFLIMLNRLKKKIQTCLQNDDFSTVDLARIQKTRDRMGPAGISPIGLSYIDFDALKLDSHWNVSNILIGSALPFTDLSLIAVKFRGELQLSWIYRENQFAQSTIKQFADEFIIRMEELTVAENKDTTFAARTFPDIKMPPARLYPDLKLIHEKLFCSMDLFSGSVAMDENGKPIPYSFLRERSYQITNALRRQVIQKNTLIGIIAYPGMEAVSGIIGIIAAGAAYVPLDPDWPDARIEQIIRHSGMKILLCSGDQTERVRLIKGLSDHIERLMILDPSQENHSIHLRTTKKITWNDEPDTKLIPLQVELNPDDLIHVMYTSGTSGNPKAVMVTHEAVDVFLDWIAGEFELDTSDRFILTSSLGFGGSIRQIYSTILAGGTMVPVPRMQMKDPEALLDFLSNHKITILNTVPTVLTWLLEVAMRRSQSGITVRLDNLRLLLIGGEVLPVETVRKWMKHFGSMPRLVNLYGSTETVVNATVYFVDEIPQETVTSIPIGKARDGSLVMLINDRGELCQVGETGEIVVGGPSIARGYLFDPELTREKFIHISPMEGLFYRTGDLARKSESGLIYYLGRSDQQIQLYGNRIELSEIENTISNSGLARSVAVIAVEEGGSPRIIAFVEPFSDRPMTDGKPVRDFVAAHLPAYMMPHQIVLTERIPLNQAGKMDKIKLKRIAESNIQTHEPESLLSPTEKILLKIWSQILKTEQLTVTDDFFRQGGDSIQLLDVIYRLEKHFPVLPSPPVFYAKRTIRRISEEIDRLNGQSSFESVRGTTEMNNDTSLIRRSSVGELKPLSPSQKGFVLAQKINPEKSPNWCIMLPVRGVVDDERLHRAVDVVIGRHPMLRTIFVRHGFQTLQKQIVPGTFPLTVLDYRTAETDDPASLLSGHFESLKNRIIDFSKWPLFTMELVRLGETESYLFLSIHHTIGDAWSMTIICNEMLRIYDSLLAGIPFDLKELRSTYHDFVNISQNLALKEITRAREFWKKQIAGYPPEPVNLLSTSAPSGEDAEADYLLQFGISEFQLLCNKAREYGTTPFILIMTIWARVIRTLTGSRKFILGTALSGRDVFLEDIHQLVGCFAKGLPIPLTLQEKAFEEEIRIVSEIFSQCYQHSCLTLGEIAEFSQKETTNTPWSFSPFFLSYMDFSSMETYKSLNLQPDWQRSRSYFSTESVEAGLMLGVIAKEELRINLYGTADPKVKVNAMDLLKAEILRLQEKSADSATFQTISETHPQDVPTQTENYRKTERVRIDSALIAYWPSAETREELIKKLLVKGLIRENVLNDLLKVNKPALVEVQTSSLGRSGIIMIPRDADQLETISRETLLSDIVDALRTASGHGAVAVSLAGNLPSRTNYCYDILKYLESTAGAASWPFITSGHATTVVAVVKNILKVLLELNVDIKKIRLGMIGFGSIGQATLSLLVESAGKPLSIAIAEKESQTPLLERMLERSKSKFRCPVNICAVKNASYPEELYDSQLLIGASTGRLILDMNRIRPGTMMADDSFPSIIPVNVAIDRMRKSRDILFIGGGKIDIGDTSSVIMGFGQKSGWLSQIIDSLGYEGNPGCRLESMMVSHHPDLPVIHGLVGEDHVRTYYRKCDELKLRAVPFHLGNYKIEQEVTDNMKRIISSLNFNIPHEQG